MKPRLCVSIGILKIDEQHVFFFNNGDLLESELWLKATYFLTYLGRRESIPKYFVPLDLNTNCSPGTDQRENSQRVFDWFQRVKFNFWKESIDYYNIDYLR